MPPDVFRSTASRPYHLSCGAVIFDNKGRILAEHYRQLSYDRSSRIFANVYRLLTETMEPGESPEACVARGAREELGVTINVLGFLGSQSNLITIAGEKVEKTTIYFCCQLAGLESETNKLFRSSAGSYRGVWIEPDLLISEMIRASAAYNEGILSEENFVRSAILFRERRKRQLPLTRDAA